MPTTVMDAIEQQVNKKSSFEEYQIKKLKSLKAALAAGNEEELNILRREIITELKTAGILNENNDLSDNYKD